MSLLKTLYNGETNFNFVPVWKRTLAVSGFLFVASVVLLLTRGLNLSIDFEGGGIWEVPVGEEVTVAEGREAVGLGVEARVQLVEDPDSGTFLRVEAGTDALSQSEDIVAALAELGDASLDRDITVDDVVTDTGSATWGSQITEKAVRALVLFFIAVSAYLAWRLEWRMAIGALAAVIHDLVVTAGVYSLTGFVVSPATVIAMLTILGYSIYDTVVVYDKILENEGLPVANGRTHTSLINVSMNQVLMRSINTTITTVLPVASMLFFGGFLGGASLSDFALALFIGLILGTYSSIFVAAPVLAWLKEREPETDEYRRRLLRAADESLVGSGGITAASRAKVAAKAKSVAAGSNGNGSRGKKNNKSDSAQELATVPAPSGPIAAKPRKKKRR